MPKESEIISLIRNRARRTDRVLVGIGDDAAVVKTKVTETTGAYDLIACSDLSLEGVHFRIEWSDAWSIGRKSLAVTLSDVAAMGAEARFALISVALPAALSSEFVDQLFRGFFDIADSYGVSIIGGDTSGSVHGLFIDTVVIGEAQSGRAVTRAGARAGDLIYVTGTLGASALGLSLLEQGRRLNESDDRAQRDAMVKHLNPEPRLIAGKAIGEAGIATAMIDISDGLSTDLWHVLDESHCGAIIRADDIPVADSVELLSPGRALQLALHGGEEYELLFTSPAGFREKVEELSNRISIPITLIGEVTSGKDLQLDRHGVFEPVQPSGYQHLA